MPNINTMMPSKFLKKGDVDEKGSIATIKAIDTDNVGTDDKPEKKWVMHFDEFDKPLVLNKTNLRRAATIFKSEETDDWIGKKINLFFDPFVEFAGEMKGGLRLKPAESDPQEESENPIPF